MPRGIRGSTTLNTNEQDSNKTPVFKDYFVTTNGAKSLALVVKPDEIMYTPSGQKIIKKAGIRVIFNHGRYTPVTDEERELLIELCKKKRYMRFVSSTEQMKNWEIDQAKRMAEEEIRKKYDTESGKTDGET